MKKFELTRKILHNNDVLVIPEGVTHIVAPIEIEDGIDMYEMAISEIHLPASCEVVDLDSFHDFLKERLRFASFPKTLDDEVPDRKILRVRHKSGSGK